MIEAERLAEIKTTDWPRFALSYLQVEEPNRATAALLAAAEEESSRKILDGYLRHYVPGDCPGCGYGIFGWGIVHGAGACSCGWPGRLFHTVFDTRDVGELVCAATCNGYGVCDARRDEHVVAVLYYDDDLSALTELRCPAPKAPPGVNPDSFTSRFRPPEIASFETLLWLHPYEVHACR